MIRTILLILLFPLVILLIPLGMITYRQEKEKKMKILYMILLFSVSAFTQTIVCLGTSLTQACYYPEVLQQELPGAKVINMGFGGKNSNTLKTKISEIIKMKPDIVLYESSINDACIVERYDKALTLDECRDNLQMICDSLKQFGLYFMTMNFPLDTLLFNRNPAKDRPHFYEYVGLFRWVATENSIPVIEILSKWYNINYLDYAPDGLHSNEKAAKELIVPEILKALK